VDEASDVQDLAGLDGAKVGGGEAKDCDGVAFPRNELDFEGVGGVAMNNRADVAYLQTGVRNWAPQYDSV
jgi:hypothetical protein